MCFWHDNSPSVFREKIVKAEKQHKCCECYRMIRPGEKYHYVFGIWEGLSDTFHTCRNCMWDRCRVRTIEDMEGCRGAEREPPFGSLRDALHDMCLEPEPAPDWFDFQELVPCPVAEWGGYEGPVPMNPEWLTTAAAKRKLGRGYQWFDG